MAETMVDFGEEWNQPLGGEWIIRYKAMKISEIYLADKGIRMLLAVMICIHRIVHSAGQVGFVTKARGFRRGFFQMIYAV